MISYYELLGMIKEDKAPKKIRVHLTPHTSKIYVRENVFDGTFSFYGLALEENEETDEYKYYLSDCLLESSMFDKNIEIIEEEKKIPKKLETWYSVLEKQSDEDNVEYANYNFSTMYEKINEIIDYLKNKGE